MEFLTEVNASLVYKLKYIDSESQQCITRALTLDNLDPIIEIRNDPNGKCFRIYNKGYKKHVTVETSIMPFISFFVSCPVDVSDFVREFPRRKVIVVGGYGGKLHVPDKETQDEPQWKYPVMFEKFSRLVTMYKDTVLSWRSLVHNDTIFAMECFVFTKDGEPETEKATLEAFEELALRIEHTLAQLKDARNLEFKASTPDV